MVTVSHSVGFEKSVGTFFKAKNPGSVTNILLYLAGIWDQFLQFLHSLVDLISPSLKSKDKANQ